MSQGNGDYLMRTVIAAVVLVLVPTLANAQPGLGNRLAYLDEVDPYYPHAKFPKLITPQWVGEEGVDAVVILAIDDMRDPKRYEAFLRPILRRLKEIDGRAPVSIMTNQVDPKDPQLQTWLKEGLSLECHTLDHPCPFFKDGFAKAKATYDKCVDLMNEIPNNKPVAFRMPCCDSLNTPSPRFYAEIFNRTTDRGKFLSIDSSVFNVFTADDPELPRELVLMPDGTERFRNYLPKDRSFVNTIEDYPYPYVIGRLCWQFPCVTPSDWQAQHLHKPNNPQTVQDWQAALDCTVIKKGVMTMVFHPHGWIRNDQMVELIDYAAKKYGKRVKFLNFREALERLAKSVGGALPLRDTATGSDNGVRVLDLNGDGFLDVVIGLMGRTQTRVWKRALNTWESLAFPADFCSVKYPMADTGFRFLSLNSGGMMSALASDSVWDTGWTLNGLVWKEEKQLAGFRYAVKGKSLSSIDSFIRDVNGDGLPEIFIYRRAGVAGPDPIRAAFVWNPIHDSWIQLPFTLPFSPSVPKPFVFETHYDSGIRFLDLDGDGKLDIIFSNENEYGVYLFKDMKEGWNRKVIAGKAGDPGALPMIANKGQNMGFFVHSGHLWWSNESTALLKDHVARVPIKELLKNVGRLP